MHVMRVTLMTVYDWWKCTQIYIVYVICLYAYQSKAAAAAVCICGFICYHSLILFWHLSFIFYTNWQLRM